jgi:gluconolactonase
MNKLFTIGLILLFSCNNKGPGNMGDIERLDPALDAIIGKDAKVEIIAEGFEWSEGPLWLEDQQMLIFSDVPMNTIYKWTEAKGKEVYLKPSGYTDSAARGGETGSNGLTLNREKKLVLCQHGNRQVAWMDADLASPKPLFRTVADNYLGKRFNSPNDVVCDSKGNYYFTDPPYGLEKNMDDPLKEIPFQGVYKVTSAGQVMLVTDSLTRPNGIALTPDEKTLIVANSDPAKASWYAFDISGDSVTNGRVFYDATPATGSGKGLPDGFKIDKQGNIFATGPGGVWIFDKTGRQLGKIKFHESTSNCALSPDERTLYVTADMYVLRIKLR